MMNYIRQAWRHPIVKGIVAIVMFVIVAEIVVVIFMPPALSAVTIPITDKIVIELGELPQWIIALVAAGGLWKAWKAEKAAVAVNVGLGIVKDDLKLLERNTNSISSRNEEIARRLGIREGEDKERVAGVETARVMAEGERVGMEKERASVAAAGKVSNETIHRANTTMTSGDDPIPVEDEAAARISRDIAKSTAESAAAANAINERVAEATEKSADAQQQLAETAKKK